MIKVNLPNAVFAYSATIIQSPPTNWFHTQSGNETNAMRCRKNDSLMSCECPGSPAERKSLTIVVICNYVPSYDCHCLVCVQYNEH